MMAIAIVPILKGLTTAHLNSAAIERKTHSLTLAQGKLDAIKAGIDHINARLDRLEKPAEEKEIIAWR